MSTLKVESVTSSTTLGEGPHWDQTEQVLYFVDILASEVHKYNPAIKKDTAVKIEGGTVSFVIPVQGQKDKFVIAVGRDIAVITWDGVSGTPSHVERIATVDDTEGKRDNILNDGKADCTGRLWTGTLGLFKGTINWIPNNGTIYSLSKDRKTTAHVSGITLSNGLSWSLDYKTMYYNDSVTDKVDAFDFDAQKGEISNRRTVFDLKANNVKGIPDGMTIDTEGKLWVACFEGSQVLHVDPTTGKLLKAIPMPVKKITSVAFGGAQMDELYVTTATIGMSDEERKADPLAGCTFRVMGTGAKGFGGQPVVL